MRSISRISIICMILILRGVGHSEPQVQPMQAKVPLLFEAKLVQCTVQMGDPIYLRFELKNANDRKVLVKRYFRLNDTVSLSIKGTRGQEVHWCGRIPDWANLPGDFVFLAPGAHLRAVIRVNCANHQKGSWGYQFPEPGEDSIRASYKLIYPLKALKRVAGSALVVKGPVEGESVHLRILPNHTS